MTRKLIFEGLYAQTHVKDMLSSAFDNKTLGHAYLFCGDPGVGSLKAAMELAMAVLCKAEDNIPCRKCDSCLKMMRLSHPDLHIIVPVCLEKEHRSNDGKLSQEGWSYLSESVKARLDSPYSVPLYPSNPAIPLEWVKEVNHAVMRGPVAGENNLIIIDGIDIMNKESANAMLKTLEEPPHGAMFILITGRSEAILPTIASRCQIIRFGCIQSDKIKKAVDEKFRTSVPDDVKDTAVRYSMGSIGRAFDLCENPPGSLIDEAAEIIDECKNVDWNRIFHHIDELSGRNDFEQYERLFRYIIYLVRNGFLSYIAGDGCYSDDIVSGYSSGTYITVTNSDTAEKCLSICREAISGLKAYGNVSIILVNSMSALTELFSNEQKQ
jgi:DNA polymerase III subunit delta'